MSIPASTTSYDHYGATGMWVESIGSLTTDIYGLSTGTAVYVSPAAAIVYPAMLSPHPLWNFLYMEKRTVSISDGLCRAACEYAGFEGIPIPVIEWSSAVSDDPIETHPSFTSFAGTASAPLNDAFWADPSTGEVTTDDSIGVFEKFAGTGSFAGVSSFLNPQIVKRVTQLSATPIIVAAGHLDGTLLKISSSSQQRGRVYINIEEWRGPGRRGWNSAIYS